MGITVIDIRLRRERAVLSEQLDHYRITFPDSFAEELFRLSAADAPSLKHAACGIDGTINGNAVALANDEIVLTVAGSGMDSAGPLV